MLCKLKLDKFKVNFGKKATTPMFRQSLCLLLCGPFKITRDTDLQTGKTHSNATAYAHSI